LKTSRGVAVYGRPSIAPPVEAGADAVCGPALLLLSGSTVIRRSPRLLSAGPLHAMGQLCGTTRKVRHVRVAVTTLVVAVLVVAVLVSPPVEGRNATGRVVRLAVIAPADRDHEQSLYRVLPAVQLAVRKVSDPITGTLPGWEIRVDHRDSRCSSTYGPLAAFDFYINRSAGTAPGGMAKCAKLPPPARPLPH
jgi:hypothetical protein